jgi:hypothetical protein
LVSKQLGSAISFNSVFKRCKKNTLYAFRDSNQKCISAFLRNFNFFYRYQLNENNENLEDQSLFMCRYVSFMAYFSMEASAWILAVITIDRYLILVNSTWKQKYSRNIKFNLAIILLIIFAVILINVPVAVLNGKTLIPKSTATTTTLISISTADNETTAATTTRQSSIIVPAVHTKRVECYTTPYITFYQKLALAIECLFPLGIMIAFNWLLIKKTYKSTTRLKKQQRQQEMRRRESSADNSNTNNTNSNMPAPRVTVRRASFNPNSPNSKQRKSSRLGASFNDLTADANINITIDNSKNATTTNNSKNNNNNNNNNKINKKSITFKPLSETEDKLRRSNHLHASNSQMFVPRGDNYFGQLRRGSHMNRSVNSINELFSPKSSGGGGGSSDADQQQQRRQSLKKSNTTNLFAGASSSNNIFMQSSMMNLTDFASSNMNALYAKAANQFSSSKKINQMRNKRIVIMRNFSTLYLEFYLT